MSQQLGEKGLDYIILFGENGGRKEMNAKPSRFIAEMDQKVWNIGHWIRKNMFNNLLICKKYSNKIENFNPFR